MTFCRRPLSQVWSLGSDDLTAALRAFTKVKVENTRVTSSSRPGGMCRTELITSVRPPWRALARRWEVTTHARTPPPSKKWKRVYSLNMHSLAYGSACKFAYITRWPEGVAGNRVLSYMQCTAEYDVHKLVEHAALVAEDCTEPEAGLIPTKRVLLFFYLNSHRRSPEESLWMWQGGRKDIHY